MAERCPNCDYILLKDGSCHMCSFGFENQRDFLLSQVEQLKQERDTAQQRIQELEAEIRKWEQVKMLIAELEEE